MHELRGLLVLADAIILLLQTCQTASWLLPARNLFGLLSLGPAADAYVVSYQMAH